MVLDSDTENVIVTWSISGVLIYKDSLRKKDQAGNQKTDALDNWYSVIHNIKPQIRVMVIQYRYIPGTQKKHVVKGAKRLYTLYDMLFL